MSGGTVGRGSVPLMAGAVATGLMAGRIFRQARRRATIDWAPGAGRDHHGALAARVLGEGAPLVLLHGLTGSRQFWGTSYDRLACDHQLIVPDLLGFGDSPKPSDGYSADDHADAVADLLDEVADRTPAVVVAHSLGCLVALRLAIRHSDLVVGIVGFGPPLYRNRTHARERLSKMGMLVGLFALDTPTAEAVCEWMCAHPTVATLLARAWRADLPTAIADDAVRHSWASYSQTLRHLIVDADSADWLEEVNVPVRLVAGSADRVVDVAFLEQLVAPLPAVDLSVWPGGHDLPLTQPAECVDAIRALVDRRVPIRGAVP